MWAMFQRITVTVNMLHVHKRYQYAKYYSNVLGTDSHIILMELIKIIHNPFGLTKYKLYAHDISVNDLISVVLIHSEIV